MESRAGARRQAGLGDLLRLFLAESRALVSDYAELAVLDARRAAMRLAWILACVLIAAVLVATAWMGGVAALIVWMLGTGMPWEGAIAIAALLNLAGDPDHAEAQRRLAELLGTYRGCARATCR